MQRKGERQTMTGKEYCRYIRTYSELEGLQRAHTVVYCAQTVPGGVLAQLRWEQAGRVQCSTVLAPQGSFARMMQIMCYLCENSIGPEQWLEVLEDVHFRSGFSTITLRSNRPGCCRKHSSPPTSTRRAAVFVAFADFVPVRLWQNMQLT